MGLPLADTMAVGDGANDLAMLLAAGLGLAYRAKPTVAAVAHARIDHGDLTALLYAQGIRRKEFVEGEDDARSGSVTRGLKRVGILFIAVGLTVATAFAIGLDRLALWQIVRACVADFKLTGAPFPCLEVDLSGGESRGDVVLRSPLAHDTILAPTRRVVGIEDPYLQSPEAPNYFSAAWGARTFLSGADGRAPEREEVALVVNSAVVRGQDQLHIHVGCILPSARRALATVAPKVPIGEWAQVGAVVPHTMFWGMRIRGTDLSDVEPFRLAAEALAD